MNRIAAGLRAAIFCCVGLLLLTPFVSAPGAIEPLAVGKALWSRSLIALAVALWAPLALARSEWRPPASWLLLLMGAGLAVECLAAFAGVSLQRSLWSDFGRMQGLVDRAHWVALAVVLASVLRRPRDWRALVGANLLVGAAVAAAVAAAAAGFELPLPGDAAAALLPRRSGPFGNMALLSAYMLINLPLAAGFALRAWLRAFRPPGGARRGFSARHGAALLWTAVAALHLAGLALANSLGAYIGLYAGACLAVAAGAALTRGRRRVAAASLCAALLLAGSATAWRFAAPGAAADAGPAPLAARMNLQWPSVQSRLAAWEAGLAGIAERPLLGWGPENYVVVFGRYGRGIAAVSESHDRAHNMPIEVAAASGLAGLTLWLARWGLALAVFLAAAWAAARGSPWAASRPGPDRERSGGEGASGPMLYVAIAAALAAHFTQLLTLFESVGTTLVATLLFAWAARLERELAPEAWHPRLPALLGRALASHTACFVLACAAAAAAFASLHANSRILDAADASHLEYWSVLDRATTERIERFPALANAWRYGYFQELGLRWNEIRAADPAAAASLLGRANRQARAAMRAEPANWRLAASIARLYAAVAETDAEYAPAAARQLARTRALAPNRDVLPVLLTTPTELAAAPLPGGSVALSWRPGAGAGYHAVSRAAEPGAWEFIYFSYDPGNRRFVAPPCPGCRYRIKACRFQGVCTDPVTWPPAGGAGPQERPGA